jgi:hypothetical protein
MNRRTESPIRPGAARPVARDLRGPKRGRSSCASVGRARGLGRDLQAGVLLDRLGLAVARLVGELHGSGGHVHRIELGGELRHDPAEGVQLAREHGLAQCGARELEPLVAQVRDRRQVLDRDLLARGVLDVLQLAVLARIDERDRDALAAGAARAPMRWT